jgi:hypothetical protein
LAAKEAGNALHKAENYTDAIAEYKKGVKLCKAAPDVEGNAAVLVACYKNIAFGYLKLTKWTDCIDWSTKALDKAPADTKALFRRAQAYWGRQAIIPNPKERIADTSKAFEDVAKVTKLDPKNKAAVQLAHKVMVELKGQQSAATSSAGISRDVLDRALTGKTAKETKDGSEAVAAFSQSATGAMELFRKGAATRLIPLLESTDPEVVVAVLHAYCNMSKHPMQALALFAALTNDSTKLTSLFNSRNVKIVRTSVMLLNMMIEACSDEAASTPQFQEALTKMLGYLIALLPHRSIIKEARDSTISAIVSNVDRTDVGKRFVDLGGVKALLIVASCARSPLHAADDESSPETGIDVSPEARMQVSVALQKIWEATLSNKPDPKMLKPKNKKREPYERMQAECVRHLVWSPDPNQNIQTCYMLTAIIQGVIELANEILDSEGVIEHIMKMCASSNLEAQCAAAEALSHAASDKKRSKSIMDNGFTILKGMYGKELPDPIRVRALCGLCKLGSHGANTSNMKSFADGAVINLAKKIRPFIIDDDKPEDCKKWASEGLAFLTLDADVKVRRLACVCGLRSVFGV